MNAGKALLLPFSLLYGLGGWARNKLFDMRLLPSVSFDIPVVSVGNLSAGGTGKTPHIEYLIRLLKPYHKGLATLSRGYGRKTQGYLMASGNCSSAEIGDEPCQFVRKFPEIYVAVDERRVHGIRRLLLETPPAGLVLLDDAYQHRYVKPGLNILLTDYFQPYFKDRVLPSGMLREFRSGARRADIIIVTKCPPVLAPIDRKNYIRNLKPAAHQRIYFSRIGYGPLQPFFPENTPPCADIKKVSSILLFAGIANMYPLEEHIRRCCTYLETMRFPDHHRYTSKEVMEIRERFTNIVGTNKILVTTEKDCMRLEDPALAGAIRDLPLYYQPIEVEFFNEDKTWFDKQVLEYAGKHQTKR